MYIKGVMSNAIFINIATLKIEQSTKIFPTLCLGIAMLTLRFRPDTQISHMLPFISRQQSCVKLRRLMNFRNSTAITAANFLRRIFSGGENFGGSRYSAAARKCRLTKAGPGLIEYNGN